MTRIDLTTRELHDLIAPVLPHASTDKTLPELGVIRIEVRDSVVYAVATDRYTMAATRHRLKEPTPDTEIAVGLADAAALLKVFKYTRSDDPELHLVVGAVREDTVLEPAERPALTVSAKDGNTLVLPGREHRPLTAWRTIMAKAIHREQKPANPHLVLTSTYLSRWAKAAGGSRLSMHVGADNEPVLVRAGEHFVGIWAPVRADSEPRLADSPWSKELPPPVDDADSAPAQKGGAA